MNVDFLRGEWRRLLVDVLVVLIGVLAALFLNNLREDVAAERAARVATGRLLQEVAQNARELRKGQDIIQRRLALLRQLSGELPAGKSLKELVNRFHGYWFMDLNASSWGYLSRSVLADSVDPDLLSDAFTLYSVNKHFDRLNGQIQDFVYSEAFVSPQKTATAIAISEAIMSQQLRWSKEMLPEYDKFVARYGDEKREGAAVAVAQ